jgi:UDP-2,3-diacylglucosamine hydrolase
VKVLPETAAIRLGSLKAHISHGDQFCTKDSGYMIFRAVIRNPVLRVAFKYLTPLFLRLWFAKLLRRSSKSIGKKKARKKVREINLAAVMRCLARGFDIAVCAHIHQPRVVELGVSGRKCRLYVLGHWDEGASYLVYEDGHFSFVPPLNR